MQKSNAAGQREQEHVFTPVPVKTDQELAKAILKALPAIKKLLTQK